MRYIIALLALLLIAGCATETVEQPAPQTEDNGDEEPLDSSEADVTFVMTGENFFFERDGERNPTLRVNEGDLVRVEFTSEQGFHDWVVDEFDAATTQVWPENGTTVVEFVADAAGTYDYYCSVGRHRQNGMVGKLIVE